MGINKVILVGHVGKDPEVQYVKEDVPVARLTLATSETYKDRNSGEKKTNTEWHNLVVWRGLAKVVEQYVKKGSQLYVEGKLSTRSYEKDGVTKYFTEVVVNNIEMLGRPSESGGSNTASTSTEAPTNQINEFDSNEASTFEETDDLPF
jgi:single-strand DNA-binding protein